MYRLYSTANNEWQKRNQLECVIISRLRRGPLKSNTYETIKAIMNTKMEYDNMKWKLIERIQ